MLRIHSESERGFFLSALVVITFWFGAVGVYLATTTSAVNLLDDHLRIPANAYLTLKVASGKSVIINRIGDTVYTDSFDFTRQKQLCGKGCSVVLPISTFYSVLVTENEDDSLTIVKPGVFSFLATKRL